MSKRLDDLWSEVVKLRDGKCQKCGKTTYLNSHHIYSRSNYSVRWDLDNGICLCAGCHALKTDSAHKDPMGFSEWIIEQKGKDFIDRLRIKAKSTVRRMKYDKELIYLYLNEQKKLLQKHNRC